MADDRKRNRYQGMDEDQIAAQQRAERLALQRALQPGGTSGADVRSALQGIDVNNAPDWLNVPQGDEWGTEGAYYNVQGGAGDSRFNERLGESTFTGPDGRTYLRLGTDDIAQFRPYMSGPGDFVDDPRWGPGLSADAANRYAVANREWAQVYGPLIAGAGLAAVTAPAWMGAGAASSGGAPAAATAVEPTVAGTGSFGGTPMFGGEHLVSGAYNFPSVAPAVTGPAPGTFGGAPLFGAEHLAYDAAAAAAGAPVSTTATPFLPTGGVPTATGTKFPGTPPTPSKGMTDIGKQVTGAALTSLVGSTAPTEEPYDPTTDLLTEQEELEARKRAAAGAIDTAFSGFNDDYYAGLAKSYRDFQTPLLEEQFGDARRAMPLRFKSTANSAYARRMGELERDRQRADTDIAKQGEDVAAQRRGEVERERGALLSQAEMGAGLDTAANQSASMARALAQPPSFSPIGDLFAKYTANAANARIASDQGYRPVRPLLFGSPTRRSVTYG